MHLDCVPQDALEADVGRLYDARAIAWHVTRARSKTKEGKGGGGRSWRALDRLKAGRGQTPRPCAHNDNGRELVLHPGREGLAPVDGPKVEDQERFLLLLRREVEVGEAERSLARLQKRTPDAQELPRDRTRAAPLRGTSARTSRTSGRGEPCRRGWAAPARALEPA
jgi:hypothetical protein